jgi:hypothetical protein
MTDISKYRNVSLTHKTYSILVKLSKVLLPHEELSISKTVSALAKEKEQKLNGKLRTKSGD